MSLQVSYIFLFGHPLYFALQFVNDYCLPTSANMLEKL